MSTSFNNIPFPRIYHSRLLCLKILLILRKYCAGNSTLSRGHSLANQGYCLAVTSQSILTTLNYGWRGRQQFVLHLVEYKSKRPTAVYESGRTEEDCYSSLKRITVVWMESQTACEGNAKKARRLCSGLLSRRCRLRECYTIKYLPQSCHDSADLCLVLRSEFKGSIPKIPYGLSTDCCHFTATTTTAIIFHAVENWMCPVKHTVLMEDIQKAL